MVRVTPATNDVVTCITRHEVREPTETIRNFAFGALAVDGGLLLGSWLYVPPSFVLSMHTSPAVTPLYFAELSLCIVKH